MKKYLGITLGIMTALGGFLDLGQIIFTAQAGAYFSYQLLWAIVLGTAAIILYMEMCGRIAVVAHEPVFSIVRTCLGFRLGLFVLIASNLLNLITCAAELGGLAIVLHLLAGWPEKSLILVSALTLGTMVQLLRFQWIERVFGLSGLLMIVFAVSALILHPDWNRLGSGLLPHFAFPSHKDGLLYAYFAVGILGMLVLACVIALTGISPLDLVNVSIIFGMVIMPLTYYPILRAASDENIMGKHVNSRFLTITGAAFLILITVAAIAAIPLMIVTHWGKP